MISFRLDKDISAAVFSYQQVRGTVLVKAGTLKSLNIGKTDWGETYIIFEGLGALITATHWGPTPLMKNLIAL